MEFALHDEDALAWLVGCFWVKVFCFFFFFFNLSFCGTSYEQITYRDGEVLGHSFLFTRLTNTNLYLEL